MNTALEIEWHHFVHSPSRKDGIPEHVERYFRSDTCKFMDEFGLKESLSGKVRLLACSLFHTFYLRVSFNAIPRWEAAVGCLIIAAKIENKVQTIKQITRAAADYLRPHIGFKDPKRLPPQQFYHWMSQIHIRERQIIERLYGELRQQLPIPYLKMKELAIICLTKDGKPLKSKKSPHLANVFRGCFQILRKMFSFILFFVFCCFVDLCFSKIGARFRSIVCIYYPPPWLAAVAVFKSLRRYNKDKKSAEPKLYLKPQWFMIYDPTNSLDLNIIQYISDQIDACDEEIVSMHDYCTKPAELNGIRDLALMKRINLIRSTPFNQLPKQIQIDLRNAFKLNGNYFIDLRSEQIKKLELLKGDCLENKIRKCSSPPSIDASAEWIYGKNEPNQREIIQKMRQSVQQQNIGNEKQKSLSLEEGEIADDEVYKNKKKNKKKQNKNANKNFMTKTHEQQELRRIEDEYHCGYESYKYVKKKQQNDDKCVINEDGDEYFVNWCTQRFAFDDNGKCVDIQPKYEKIENLKPSDFVYRIPTPNYMPTGNTPNDSQNGCSPITPGYGISPMNVSAVAITPQSQMAVNEDGGDEYWKRGYHNNLNDDMDADANDMSYNNNNNNNKKKNDAPSFTTKTARNNQSNYQAQEPPYKKSRLL